MKFICYHCKVTSVIFIINSYAEVRLNTRNIKNKNAIYENRKF